ncbi:MAG: antibiotic biosynthesis monooxygenase [Anaerolineaceae bacterium]|nr:antibiotic biosynthesis monooxygenase [Anaerolineaceae bacterium]
MVQFIWKHVINDKAHNRFELTFGPGGPWSKLFADCPGFRGTTVLRDTRNPQQYLIIDTWDSETMREQALSEHKQAYNKLEIEIDQWVETRTEIGIFNMRAQAAVRSRTRKGSIHNRLK